MSTLSLLPVVIDLRMVQGCDYTIEFQLTDGKGKPVPITADSVKFTAKTTHSGTVTIATKTNAAGGHSDATNGKTKFVLSKTDLTTQTPGHAVSWVYEVRRVISGGQEVVYITGTLYLEPTVGL